MNEKLDRLFSQFGVAAHHAQFIGYDLVSLYLVDAIHKGQAKSREDLLNSEAIWEDKSLGQLIKYIKMSPYVKEDIKEFFNTVRDKRNYLMHKFFVLHLENMLSESGIEVAQADLDSIVILLKKCQSLVHDTAANLASDLSTKNSKQ